MTYVRYTLHEFRVANMASDYVVVDLDGRIVSRWVDYNRALQETAKLNKGKNK